MTMHQSGNVPSAGVAGVLALYANKRAKIVDAFYFVPLLLCCLLHNTTLPLSTPTFCKIPLLLFPISIIHNQQYVSRQRGDDPTTNELQCLRHA